MFEIITPKSINFTELVKHSNTTLSLDVQTKIIELLNTESTENEHYKTNI